MKNVKQILKSFFKKAESHSTLFPLPSSLSHQGFTIIELLVASLLLGMLVTILTMIFNQSSIAWRIGVAATSNMDDVRDNIAALREEADNAFVYNNEIYRTVGLWKNDGSGLRDRAVGVQGSTVFSEIGAEAKFLKNQANSFVLQRKPWNNNGMIGVDGADKRSNPNFTVNVMSKGPRNDENDWQAIYSQPDDPEEWCK